MRSRAKKVWRGLWVWSSVLLNEYDEYEIDLCITIQEGREEGRHVSCRLNSKEAREVAARLAELADRRDLYASERH